MTSDLGIPPVLSAQDALIALCCSPPRAATAPASTGR